jgi:hypothetical protein
MTIQAGTKVKFWRNKRPLTLRDFQEGVVVAVGPTEAQAGDEEKGVSVALAAGEFWLRVKNAANGKTFFVVAKPSDAPSPGAFTPEQAQAASAPPAAAPVVTSEEQGSGGGAEA